jgi:hypothetical protein
MVLDPPDADDPALADVAAFRAAHAAYRAAVEAEPLPAPAPFQPDPRLIRPAGPPRPYGLQNAFHGPTLAESDRRADAIRRRLLRSVVPDLSAVWAAHATNLDTSRNPVRTVATDAWDHTVVGRNRPAPWRRSDRARTPVTYSATGPILAVRSRIPLPCPSVPVAVLFGMLSCRPWEVWTDPTSVRLTDVAPPRRTLACESCGMAAKSPHLGCSVTDDYGRERLARLVQSWTIVGGTVRTRAPRVTVADRPRPDNVRTFECRGCGASVTEPRRQGRPSVRCGDCRDKRNGR